MDNYLSLRWPKGPGLQPPPVPSPTARPAPRPKAKRTPRRWIVPAVCIVLALVFDRFHKTDRSRSADRDGVGLGLYIVKTILNSHKENIVCTSEDGITKFVFTLTRA